MWETNPPSCTSYNSKKRVKQKGTKTERGKYAGKYALSELLVCGECGTPYRRKHWKKHDGTKQCVWRCIARMDKSGRCKHSPYLEEQSLQRAIMEAIFKTATLNSDVLETLRLHIGMGLEDSDTADNALELQIRIAQIDAEFAEMLKAVASDNEDEFDEQRAKELMDEKSSLQLQLDRMEEAKQKRLNTLSRLDEIYEVLEIISRHPMEFDNYVVRMLLECVVVESKHKIKVVFIGGLEVEQEVEDDKQK